ncbi:phosphoribosylglycinamide formyltransferase [Candidatus Woesearchaeota archaeon]|nr:phosphoribosylglycinamide formyltransferase [Candidatus Woesearchaeota archaeon]
MANNIAILASTKGTDMQAIIDAIDKKKLDAKIKFVLSNKSDNYALTRAKKHGIPSIFLDPKGKPRKKYDREISGLIEKHDVALILLIGYMKLMSPWFVEKYKNRVMNIHPSILPMFAGGMDLNVHEQVIQRGSKVSGCSLIFVDKGADTGPIILQKTVPVRFEDSPEDLKKRVQKAEQDILLKGIQLFFNGKLLVEENKVKILK